MAESAAANEARANGAGAMTGVTGLDDIMCGGLTPGRVFLLEGSPGTGKTTTAIRFLLRGASGGAGALHHAVPRPTPSFAKAR